MQTERLSTPSARRAEDLEALLTGRYVRCRQYIPGYYQRDAFYTLWKAVEEDDAALQILYGRLGREHPGTPIDTRGDLADFIEFFASDNKLIVIVEDVKTGELAGFLWLEDMVPKFKATVNLFFRKKYRGKAAFEGARIFRDYVCGALGFPTLWGLTPWKHSVAVGRWLGMKTIAVLPGFQLIEGKPYDVYVLRYTHG